MHIEPCARQKMCNERKQSYASHKQENYKKYNEKLKMPPEAERQEKRKTQQTQDEIITTWSRRKCRKLDCLIM